MSKQPDLTNMNAFQIMQMVTLQWPWRLNEAKQAALINLNTCPSLYHSTLGMKLPYSRIHIVELKTWISKPSGDTRYYNISEKRVWYHSSCHPGYLRHQAISCNGIDYVEWACSSFNFVRKIFTKYSNDLSLTMHAPGWVRSWGHDAWLLQVRLTWDINSQNSYWLVKAPCWEGTEAP